MTDVCSLSKLSAGTQSWILSPEGELWKHSEYAARHHAVHWVSNDKQASSDTKADNADAGQS